MSTVNGINSKENVKEFGEVFTPDSIVNDMLDLVDKSLKEENISPEEYLAKTYLEPSCGDGQFLIRILDRKLACIVANLPKEQWELAVVKAVSTIYGIDIQKINVENSKRRMMTLLKDGTVSTFDLPDKEIRSFTKVELNWTPELEKAIQYILDNNIIHGDALGKTEGLEEVLITEYTWRGTEFSQQRYPLSNINLPVGGSVDFQDYRHINDKDEEDWDDEDNYDF